MKSDLTPAVRAATAANRRLNELSACIKNEVPFNATVEAARRFVKAADKLAKTQR